MQDLTPKGAASVASVCTPKCAEKSLSGGVSGHFFFFFGLKISKFDIFSLGGGGGKVTLFRLAVGIIFFFFFFFYNKKKKKKKKPKGGGGGGGV